jgi:L-Ala-D/L-Glu epimerase
MKITACEVWEESLELKEPYTISYETYTAAHIVFLRIETDKGISAYGAASPDEHVTGETTGTIIKTLSESCFPYLLHKDPLRHVYLLDHLKKALHHQPSAKACIDMALYDLLGKSCGIPVWKLLGGFRTRMKTSVTVGILPVDQMLDRIDRWYAQGVRIIKLKGGMNVGEDLMKLHRITELYGKQIRLRFDANQGYSAQEASYFIQHLPAGCVLEVLEQPGLSDDQQLMGALSKKGSIPIMADESILGLRDAFHFARHDLMDMINIKLMKAGGITNALHINSVALAAGVEVMTGCMDECALGIAAGLHFALSRPNITCADLDSHLDIIGDPTAGTVVLKDGYLYPSEAIGLGMKVSL